MIQWYSSKKDNFTTNDYFNILFIVYINIYNNRDKNNENFNFIFLNEVEFVYHWTKYKCYYIYIYMYVYDVFNKLFIGITRQ